MQDVYNKPERADKEQQLLSRKTILQDDCRRLRRKLLENEQEIREIDRELVSLKGE
ncbi:hypothetical protein [Pseudoalteromonas phage J2-1_QLiu-2017]|nr:hypothetical protein [Pseudoalteromonas phage J2-1_QLiu-2017]